MSGQSFDQENENFMDKENQRAGRESDDEDAADEQQRYIFERQQYQRSQFYEQQAHRRPSTMGDEEERSPGTSAPYEPMDEDLSSSDSKLVESVPEYLVEKIGHERWAGVNGHYDDKGEWRAWNEMASGYNSYSKEPVFILPYVSVDYQSLNISC